MVAVAVRKSETLIEADEIVSDLKHTLRFRAVCDSVLHQKIINQAAASRNLILTDEEVQEAVDSLRLEMRLEKASDTLAWLEKQGISPEDWEVGIRDRLLSKKLRNHLFEGDVERHFNENRLQFDKVLLYQIVVENFELAQELFYQIEESEISFFEAAHHYDLDTGRRDRCGYEGLVARQGLPATISAALFNTSPGELVGPVQTEAGYHLMFCKAVLSGELTDEVRESILDSLFREWLAGELNHLLHS